MTNQPMKERACQSRKSLPSTTAAVKSAGCHCAHNLRLRGRGANPHNS